MALDKRILFQRQNSMSEIAFGIVDGSAVPVTAVAKTSAENKAALPEGWTQAIAFKNGTGDYTITYTEKARRNLLVLGVTPLAGFDVRVSAVTANSVRFLVFDASTGLAADGDFHFSLIKLMNPSQY